MIDPVLTYATYAGGSGSETGSAIAVDATGSAYLAGTTDSADFAMLRGAPTSGVRGFIAKLDGRGTNAVATAVIGGATIAGIALDTTGNVVVAGSITGSTFPGSTSGAYQTGSATGFIAKFTQDAAGFKLLFVSTIAATPTGVALDAFGAIYVTGSAGAAFQATPGAVQTSNAGNTCFSIFTGSRPCPDAFVLKLSSDGSRLNYATYLGGGGEDMGRAIAVNSGGEAYIAGDTSSSDFKITPGASQIIFGGRVSGEVQTYGDAFVAKLDAAGGSLIFSTYLGGTLPDVAYAVAVDRDGNAYVSGGTQSLDFPVTAGAFQSKYAGGASVDLVGPDPAGDAFVTKFSPSGLRLWSTFLGGSSREIAAAVGVDAAGNVYAAGSSESSDFPWTAGAVRGCRAGGPWVAQLNNSGTILLRSSSVGGMGFDQGNALAIDFSSSVYLAGDASSRVFFPTGLAAQKAYGGGDRDAFAAKLDLQNLGRVFVACVLNSASFAAGNFAFFPQGAVAPGELVSIFGSALGPDQPAVAQPAAGTAYPTTLGGTQVLFDGVPAPIWYASSTQINAVVPNSIKTPVTQMIVQRNGNSDGPHTLPVSATVPAIFTTDRTGQGQAAVFNQDGSNNSPSNPAGRGSVVVFYAVGAGLMTPSVADGAVLPLSSPLPIPQAPSQCRSVGSMRRCCMREQPPGIFPVCYK